MAQPAHLTFVRSTAVKGEGAELLQPVGLLIQRVSGTRKILKTFRIKVKKVF